MKTFTYVVLSPEPSEAPAFLPDDVIWYNHVSKFNDHKGLHKARLDSLRGITTPYWIYVDSDDPLPDGVREPNGSAILYGQEKRHLLFKNCVVHMPTRPFSWLRHIKEPHVIHKAICNTYYAQKVIEYLPQEGAYLTEALIFTLLSQWRGSEIDKNFNYNWNVREGGCHTWPDVHEAVINTSKWLIENGKNTLKELMQKLP